jgi:prophage antirepressor-like protein
MTNTTTQIPFNFDFNGHQLRAFSINQEPWLIAKDVCRVLEITNISRAVETLDEDEKGMITTHTLGGPQRLLAVTESGLYGLVFKSRKPDAKAFRKWVTSIVLPAIRKDGMYIEGEEHATTEAELVALAQRALDGLMSKLEEKQRQLDEQATKMADYDTRWTRKDSIGLTEFARQVGLRPNKFTETLRSLGYLFNRRGTNNIPYAAHTDTLFVRRETTQGFGQTLLTQAGCEHFTKMVAAGSFDAVKAA